MIRLSTPNRQEKNATDCAMALLFVQLSSTGAMWLSIETIKSHAASGSQLL